MSAADIIPLVALFAGGFFVGFGVAFYLRWRATR